MVTRDLAKVETAGSSPVYRSLQQKGYPIGYPFLLQGAKRSHSPAVRVLVSASLRSAQSRRPLDVLRPSIALIAKRSHSSALRLLVSASRLHFVSVVSKPTSTGCRETVRAKPRSPGPRAPSIALTTKRIFERSLLSESIKKVT